MPALPCKHQPHVMAQVQPTIHLLSNLDDLHPDILLEHDIVPEDYKGGLVFRSAIESIRGTFIASSTAGRQALVASVLENLRVSKRIAGFQHTSSSNRYDFTVAIENDPDYYAALEVKGGEGNSINISERPIFAKEFAVWSHLDGAIVNQPAKGAHSILNRLTNEMVRRNKMVDMLFFKDLLCGTRARPCPKYLGQETTIGMNVAPDVFLFPREQPTEENPTPSVHTLDTLKLPKLILELYGVAEADMLHHIWEVNVSVEDAGAGKLRRSLRIVHEGKTVDEAVSRAWQRGHS